MTSRMIRIVALLAVVAVASLMGANAYAKRGADDKPKVEQRGGQGADDPAGDDRNGRGRGTDDVRTARHGADDPAGDDRGGRRGAKRSRHHHKRRGHRAVHSRHGADDPSGDDRQGRGKRGGRRNDDAVLAKNGADDPAGHDRRGRGRRNDDKVLT